MYTRLGVLPYVKDDDSKMSKFIISQKKTLIENGSITAKALVNVEPTLEVGAKQGRRGTVK